MSDRLTADEILERVQERRLPHLDAQRLVGLRDPEEVRLMSRRLDAVKAFG